MALRSFLSSIIRDERGSAVEFAIVLPLLLIFALGTIDVGLYAWRLNQAEKATQMGARWAAVTSPLANEIASTSYVNANVGGTLITQGDRVPASALSLISCTSTSCTGAGCSTAPITSCTYNSGAFAGLRDTMQRVLPSIENDNIVVEYRGSGLGFAGDPNGPDIAPVITVRLVDMEFTPITFALFGGNIGLPDFAYSLTAEDAAGDEAFF